MDELLLRRMPHSLEAEQSVLGSILIDFERVPDVLGVLKSPDLFYLEANRQIFETIVSMFNRSLAIDPVTVLSQMEADGTATESTGAYLVELMHITPTAVNAKAYAEIVADKALLRKLVEITANITDLAHLGGGTADEVLEVAEKEIFSLRQNRSAGGLVPIHSVIHSAYALIREAASREAEFPGISTGLADLDKAILGLNRSDLILIAARPGLGKTTLALNIALNAAKDSKKAVAVFSLEMGREQLAIRLLANESFVDTKLLQRGKLSLSDWEKLGRAAVEISKTKILVDDNPAASVADMKAQCRRLGDDLGLIVIDYLQLMTSATGGAAPANQNRAQVVADISRYLKIMAKELNVPVVALSQLNRASTLRADKRPALSDLRESGAIEQDADIVMALYQEEESATSEALASEAECIILKNRHGERGTVKLTWFKKYSAYRTMDQRSED